jgi:endonuclease/exonuclease/phosphatase family metal-dependent hydrolase
LFARFRFDKNVDPEKAVKDGWLANKTYFSVDNETEKALTAAAIKTTKADVIALQEIESLQALKGFRNKYLKYQGYHHAFLVDGNDPRLIDIGILSRFPIERIDTHIHEWDKDLRSPLFSRDCLECDIVLPEKKRLRLFINHFKSMYNPEDKCNGRRATREKREHQAMRVKEIVSEEFPNGEDDQQHPFAILGDFNDYLQTDSQGKTSIGKLVKWNRVENIVARLPKEDQWTHYYKGDRSCGFGKNYKQLDYILLSKPLADSNPDTEIKIIRDGLPKSADKYNGHRFANIGMHKPKASDHCPVVVQLQV